MSNVRLLASIRDGWHFRILKKGIKVTLVSVPVLPSPSPPSTVYRRPLSIMLFGGRGGDLSITILTAAHVWLPTRSWFIEGAACCLYNGSTNLFWSFANHRWRAMQSFIWLCLIRSRMAYEQQKLSSAARSWNYSVSLCHVGRTAGSSKTRQEQKLRVRLPLKGKPVTWLLQMKCHHYG